MNRTKTNLNRVIMLLILAILLSGTIIAPISQALNVKYIKGFDKGPSYTSVVPIKKTTFVQFDDKNLYDDYAYLAAIPTAVFNSDNKLYSHPLLFYQDEIEITGEPAIKKSDTHNDNNILNAYTGIYYLMEDWMSYCGGKQDQMTLINVDKSNVNQWPAKEYITINSESPYEISKILALQDWEYSDEVVVAVIDEEFETPDNEVIGKVESTFPQAKTELKKLFITKQTNSLNPVSGNFEITEQYKQLFVEVWWEGILLGGKMVPAGDPDFQMAFKNGDDWMYANVASEWNVNRPAGHEVKHTYVYQPGEWRVTVTDYPTKGLPYDEEDSIHRKEIIPGILEIQGSLLSIFRKDVKYYVEASLYPGIDVKILDIPTFGVEDAEFKLTWDDPNVNLGFTLLGPSGEVIYSDYNESREGNQEMYIERLGECPENEYYSISVYSTKNVDKPLDFEVEYSWKQAVAKEKADSLTSATEGAVLASSLNAPLLYIKPTSVPNEIKDVLYQLGVNHVYFVDIGSRATNDVEKEIDEAVDTVSEFKDCRKIYDKIREISGSNDVVFTSIDPWTPFTVSELKPLEEREGAFYIGPAAYSAAHHGTPAIIVEQHPKLSSAVTWHNEFWRRFSFMRLLNKPPVAEMVFTGMKVYDFLKDYGFDKEGKETIITVAGQFEIGTPWDRVFVGVANPGRICGTPVDTSVWISRSMFYPALIYENPALQGEVEMETGSTSERQGLLGLFKKPLLNSLVITKESHKEKFEFPVLNSFVLLTHRFNERASEYWGSKYQCADGLIPGETTTMEAIDQGVNLKYTGDAGSYFPDMSCSDVVPIYLERGGYDPVYATRLEVVIENLNKGVILWNHVSHGNQGRGGQTLFWDPQNGFKEELTRLGKFTGAYHEYNPWRGYDWLLGSTDEPDTMSMDIEGYYKYTNIPMLLRQGNGMDYVLAKKPVREWLVERPILGRFLSRIFTVDDLYDGITGSLHYSKQNLVWKNYAQLEEAGIDNLHSAGFITGICQASSTYFHLMLVRHGTVFQVMDPWPTSWYGCVWEQSIPRDIILGDTVGEAYSKGIAHVGTLYLGGGVDGGPQWWWDDSENVVYFGDPELRMFVPENEYSNVNYWEKSDTMAINYDKEVSLDGHTPFGADSYPNARDPQSFLEEYLLWIILIVILVVILISIAASRRHKKSK